MLTQIQVALVSTASPVNAYLFPEYILPKLELFTPLSGPLPSPLVRVTYACCIATLAETASRFLDVIQALKADGSLPAADPDADDGVSVHPYQNLFDVARADLVRFFESQTTALLTDNHSDVRRAFLGSVSSLCMFFGTAKSNDVILSHLNTYLNDRDWRLKCAFFETIVGVATFVGGSNLEEFILPLMVQALTDAEEAVVEKVITSLASMAQLGLFQRSKAWELVDLVGRFTMHPNIWVREAAAYFVSSAVKYASPADCECIVKPLIKPYLRVTPSTYSEVDLLDSLKKPLSRVTYDMAVSWATKVEKGIFWRPADPRSSADLIGNLMPVISSRIVGTMTLAKLTKHEEDQQWISRLRNTGLTFEDDIKLIALREYIWRMANRKIREEEDTGTADLNKVITLKDLAIAPETVFFDHDQRIESLAPSAPNRIEKNDLEKEPQSIADALLDASTPIATATTKRTTSTANHPAARMIRKNFLQSQTGTPLATSPLASSPAISVDMSGTNRPGSLSSKNSLRELDESGSPMNDSQSFLSPNDRLGQMKHNHGLRHKGSAIDLMQRKPSLTPSVTKAEAEISTFSENALGTVDGSSITKHSSPLVTVYMEKQLDAPEIRFQGAHTYSGRDPNVLRLLDVVYLENHPMDTADFGPSIIPIERRRWDKKGVNSSNGIWRPEGVLIAMFNEHTAAVVRVLVAPDHSFFLTGSEDGTVKIWDCARLERNLAHRSKQTYRHSHDAKVTSLCFLENAHSFVSTASDGSLHVVRVDYTEVSQGTAKYGKLRLLREFSLPDPSSYVVWLEHIKVEGQSTLLMATNTSQIHALDMKTMEILYTLENPVHHGTPTCFYVDKSRHWLLLGTSHGVLDVWDLRFRVRGQSWGFPGAAPIHRVCPHPIDSTEKTLVVVAGGTGFGDVTIWDLENFICVEVYRTASNTSPILSTSQQPHASVSLKSYTPWFPDTSPSSTLIDRFASSSPPRPSTAETATTTTPNPLEIPQTDRSVRALITGYRPPAEPGQKPRHGFLIAAGPDRKVRFWDLDHMDASCVVSGLEADERQPGFLSRRLIASDGTECAVCEEQTERMQHESDNGGAAAEAGRAGKSPAGKEKTSSTKSPRSTVISLEQQRLLTSHLDCVLDVALVEYPVNMVVSVDRSGAVYVFQ